MEDEGWGKVYELPAFYYWFGGDLAEGGGIALILQVV